MDGKKIAIIALVTLASTALGYALLGLRSAQTTPDASPASTAVELGGRNGAATAVLYQAVTAATGDRWESESDEHHERGDEDHLEREGHSDDD